MCMTHLMMRLDGRDKRLFNLPAEEHNIAILAALIDSDSNSCKHVTDGTVAM